MSERLGRYELLSVLGRGGSGVVYEAVMHGLAGFRKRVALKLLKGGSDDASARAALQREARLGALLSHPNVVSILDLGRTGDSWFIAMELVVGASVSALVRAGELAPSAVLDIGLQVCAGLGHIHGLRVDGGPGALVHRDVKPQNLLVDESGLVKIADFGIAALQGSGGIMGTPRWMAPEQLDGRADPRSDLFALGCVLYVLATRRPPLPAARQASERARQCEARLRDLAGVDASVPGLGSIVARCLHPDPAERWPDATTLGAALRTVRTAFPEPPRLAERVAEARGAPPPAPETAGTPHGATIDTVVLTPQATLDLPVVDAPLVGRDADRDEVAAWLGASSRLVTLLGPGGVGKSRLALAVAAAVGRRLSGGAVLIGLADASTASGICAAAATRLRLPALRGDPVDQVGHVLQNRGPVVVVLDDAERAAGALAEVLGRWLEQAPEARFLVTSRLPLRLRAERTLKLGPLEETDAVALFRALQGDAPTGDDAVVAQLVRALDGLPLAIELAAARSRVMRPETLLDRLSDRFRLLAGGKSDRRHATLRASIDASWELLRPWEQAAMGQLAVFADGIALADAEAALDLGAWSEAPWALDVLTALVDCSLLRFEPEAERFRAMVSVQEYALATLDPERRRAAEIRHGETFARLGQADVLEALFRHGGEAHRSRLHVERENLLVACERAVGREDASIAAATGLAAAHVLRDVGPLATGDALITRVLALPDVPRRAELHVARGQLRSSLGRWDEARADLVTARETAEEEGDLRVALGARALLTRAGGRQPGAAAELREVVALARAHGETRAEARALSMLGYELCEGRELAPAREHLERALGLFRRVGDVQGEALVHLRLGQVDRAEGRTRAARRRSEQAIRLFRAAGDRHNATAALGNIAVCLVDEGRLADARAAFEAVLEQDRELGHREGEASALANLAVLDRWDGRPDDARARNQAALRIVREVGDRAEEARVLSNLALLDDMLGDLGSAEREASDAAALYRELGLEHEAQRTETILARLALAQGNAEQALAILDAGAPLSLAPRRAADRAEVRVEALLRLGRIDDARSAVDVLASCAEADADCALELHLARARVAVAAGASADALASLLAADELVEGQVPTELWLVRAEALHAAGEPAKRDRALAAAASALARSGNRPGSCLGLALQSATPAAGGTPRARPGQQG